jgi:hypothetical protein
MCNMNKRTTFLTVRLQPQTHHAFRDKATRYGGVSEVLRELVEAFMQTTGFDYAQSVADGLTAAVAYRTPDGHPELVPWVEVEALVDAARGAREQIEWLVDHVAEDWAPEAESAAEYDLANLVAALAPFT